MCIVKCIFSDQIIFMVHIPFNRVVTLVSVPVYITLNLSPATFCILVKITASKVNTRVMIALLFNTVQNYFFKQN